jgi:putative hydrolase
MAPPDDGGSVNPFQSLLGDLLNMLGSNAPDQWEMSRSFAVNVATGGEPESNVEPLQRIKLEQLSRVAELNVIEATGLPVSPDGRRLVCVPVGRADWTLRALDSWRPILTKMAPTPGAVPPLPTDAEEARPDLFGGDGDLAGLGGLLGQWATAIGPMLFGLQIGSVVGHLSHRALGQYPLALPWTPSDELLVVTSNIASFAEDWSLPEEEALVWICAREMASNSVLSRPAVRGRLEELLLASAESSASAQQNLTGMLQGLGGPGGADGTDDNPGMDLESLQRMFDDPEALLGHLLTPESRRTSDQLTGLAVVIDAYADHIADLVGQKLVGSHSQLREAWYRRRTERGKGEEAAGSLFGLDLDQAQVDRGRSFISGVIERAGEVGLAMLWSSVDHLPTPSEIDAPGLWLARINLPELDQPPGSGSD